MNIHPMFVHFPVALFLVYSLLEIIRFKSFSSKEYWFYTKAIIVILGTLSAFVTLSTGEMAEHVYAGPLMQISQGFTHHIIDIHSSVASITTCVYSLIAFFYIIGWWRRHNVKPQESSSFVKIWNFLTYFEKHITEGFGGILLALIGASLISATGALGGLIAYGPNNDPISNLIYNFLIK